MTRTRNSRCGNGDKDDVVGNTINKSANTDAATAKDKGPSDVGNGGQVAGFGDEIHNSANADIAAEG